MILKIIEIFDSVVRGFLGFRALERAVVFTRLYDELQIKEKYGQCELPPSPLTAHLTSPVLAQVLSPNTARLVDNSNKFVQYVKLGYEGKYAEMVTQAVISTSAMISSANAFENEQIRATYLDEIKKIDSYIDPQQCPNISLENLYSLNQKTVNTSQDIFSLSIFETGSIVFTTILSHFMLFKNGKLGIGPAITGIGGLAANLLSRYTHLKLTELKLQLEQKEATDVLEEFFVNCLADHFNCPNGKLEEFLSGQCSMLLKSEA